MNVSDIVHRFSPETLDPPQPKTTRQRHARGRDLGGFSPQPASEVKHDAHAPRGPFVHHDGAPIVPRARIVAVVIEPARLIVMVVLIVVVTIVEVDLEILGRLSVRRTTRNLDAKSRAIGFLATTTLVVALANLLDDVGIEHGHL
ncbi:MAG: hypothetical protein H6729_11590 [Deltaproteobacteria bacterium]|nr:hypothetical protein [Deltaproteobacteria bacterium]